VFLEMRQKATGMTYQVHICNIQGLVTREPHIPISNPSVCLCEFLWRLAGFLSSKAQPDMRLTDDGCCEGQETWREQNKCQGQRRQKRRWWKEAKRFSSVGEFKVTLHIINYNESSARV
jgi:hypothetical protein